MKDNADLVERFQSICYHTINKHRWSGCKTFKKCAHQTLRQTSDRKVKWFKQNSVAYTEFCKIILSTHLKNDLLQIGNAVHTTLIEVSIIYIIYF